MKLLSTQKYQSPAVRMTQVELEGLLCQSISTRAYVDEARNIAAETTSSGAPLEESYFEF